MKTDTKTSICFLALLLCCIFPVSCGKQSDQENETPDDPYAAEDLTEFYDITVKATEFPSFSQADPELIFLGMQFYQEEPILLLGKFDEESPLRTVFQYQSDGNLKLLSDQIPYEYIRLYKEWYLDREGNFYIWRKEPQSYEDTLTDYYFTIMNLSGTELYKKEAREEGFPQVIDMCQGPDGSLCWIVNEDGISKFSRTKPVQAPASVYNEILPDPAGYGGLELGMGERNGFGLSRKDGFWFINEAESTLTEALLFQGTSYNEWNGVTGENRSKQDFRILEDGSVELLWAWPDGSGAVCETLRLEKVKKIPIVVRAEFAGFWLKNQISSFNQTNDSYHIIIDEFQGDGEKWSSYDSDLEDYVRLTNVQLTAGKGPDILIGDSVLGNSVYDLIDMDIFEDLAPYLKKDGVREEDYFPVAFASRRRGDKVYGICPLFTLQLYKTDASLFDRKAIPDIETLTDALLNHKDPATYLSGATSSELLRLFLEGSETL